ncbi:TPA: adhesin biosynthesis transcription regulatory family protein [Escherichia coli]|nr:adhesin biosynthesis transcription regulatory family protein [Escherichia coli]
MYIDNYLIMRKINMEETILSLTSYQLRPGKVDKKQFVLLIDISSIRSYKVINALEDYFVNGKNRKEICDNHKINQGYLSLKIRELQDISLRIYNISHCI